jgi:hypothetical protein
VAGAREVAPATSTGDERDRRSGGGTSSATTARGVVWSLRVLGGKATAVRVEPFKIPSLTSFGEDAAGELYATSQDGVLYRIS